MRYTHPEDDRVFACPSCDVAGEVYRRTHKNKTFDAPFRCHKCGAEFDDPVDREPKPKSVGGSGEDDDGLPPQLNDDAKEMIRSIRGP